MRNYIPVKKLYFMNLKIMSRENILDLRDHFIKNKHIHCKDLCCCGLEFIDEWLHNNEYNGIQDKNAEKWLQKQLRKMNKDYSYIYLTLSPDHILRKIEYSPKNIKTLKEWCEKWFDPKRYIFSEYVVESGENSEDPHLHVHALVRLRHTKSNKNHSRDLKKFWSKYFPKSQLIGSDYYSKNVSRKFFLDKLDYFKNAKKGSHENFVDLGISGSYSDE